MGIRVGSSETAWHGKRIEHTLNEKRDGAHGIAWHRWRTEWDGRLCFHVCCFFCHAIHTQHTVLFTRLTLSSWIFGAVLVLFSFSYVFVRTYVRSVSPFCSLQRAPNILRRFLRIFLWFALHVCVCARVTMCIWSFSHMYVFCCYLSSFIVRRVSLSRSLTPVAQRAFAITFIRSCTHDDIIPNNSYSHIRDNIHDVCAFIFDTQHRGSSLVVVVVRFTAICIYTSRASLIRKKKYL